jgi:hypothetical protein
MLGAHTPIGDALVDGGRLHEAGEALGPSMAARASSPVWRLVRLGVYRVWSRVRRGGRGQGMGGGLAAVQEIVGALRVSGAVKTGAREGSSVSRHGVGTDGPEHQEWSRRVIDRKPKEAGSKSPKDEAGRGGDRHRALLPCTITGTPALP